MKRYDVLVIGSGPSGHRAAIQAAKLGKKTAVIEKRQMVGGVCLNTGTIPSKTLREAVVYLTGLRQRTLYGSSYSVKQNVTMEDLRFRSNHVIEREIDVLQGQFRRNGIQLLHGAASFLDPHRLLVKGGDDTDELSAGTIVIATGTSPARSDQVPLDGTSILDSDMLLRIPVLPKSITVVGAGVVGAEYACMTAALGIPTTLVESRDRMLEFVDSEIIESLRYRMRDMEVTFRFGETVESVRKTQEGLVTAVLASRKEIRSDALLYAVGRQGNTRFLNLEAAGLEADDRGRIQVNRHYQTRVPHVYAVGDVVGFPSLASVSMMQGRLAICHAFDVPPGPPPSCFPTASTPSLKFPTSAGTKTSSPRTGSPMRSGRPATGKPPAGTSSAISRACSNCCFTARPGSCWECTSLAKMPPSWFTSDKRCWPWEGGWTTS